MVVEADWRTLILNESVATNSYLRDLSTHCTQVRKDARRVINSVKASVSRYEEAEEGIKKAFSRKMEEIQLI